MKLTLMKLTEAAKLLVLPSLALGGAVLLLGPSRPAQAFDKWVGTLAETQRDVRLFNNFADSTANNNVLAQSQFPGFDGAELAIWKGVVEWGSTLHGDGTGDAGGGNPLGDGGANFDAMWAGRAAAGGSTNHNIVSVTPSCGGGGTLAFTEGPISDGWRIIFCDEHIWDDGPAGVGGRWDIQGVMAHEYGHALGLDHSDVGAATMFATGSPGSLTERSIHSDDILGVQCLYGVASATKPVITGTAANPSTDTLTIFGSQFGATGNEVWLTNVNATATNVDPIVRITGVDSTGGGTQISVTIPVDAGPGDVIVNKSGAGGATLSNAFPTDLEGNFGTIPGTHPNLTGVSPSSIEALIPGTDQTITLTGTDLDLVTDVVLDDVAVPVTSYSIVNSTTITLDMPQASSLGLHDLGVSDGIVQDEFAVTIVVPASPKLQLGNGDTANVVDRDDGLHVWVGGQPGIPHLVRGGPTAASLSGFELKLALVPHGAFVLIDAGPREVGAAAWGHVLLEDLPDPNLVGSTWFFRSYALQRPRPFPESNLQSITLVP